MKYLTVAELDLLLANVPEDDLGQMEKVLYLTACQTGMRQGELIALRWSDIDWLSSKIRVQRNYTRGQFGTPKSGKSRTVPMAMKVASELEALSQRSNFAADDDLVFCHPHTGNPYDGSKCLKRFKKVRDKAGVTPITFHQLRHTFGIQMAAAGTAMRTLQEFMGHQDFQTTLRYAHFAPGHQDAELVAKAFGAEDQAPELEASARSV